VVPDNVIDVLNSGTTLRFFTAITSLARGTSVLTGDASIRTRPNTPLLQALSDLGADAFSTKEDGTAPIVVQGPLMGGRTRISGSISSQFISALLIACPLAEEDSTIEIEGELKSRPYVDVTLEVLREAGIEIRESDSGFLVKGGQRFDLKRYAVPGDFSSSSYLLAAGVLVGEHVTIRNLYRSAQGDSAIIQILKEMGAEIAWDQEKGEVTIARSDLHGVTVDVGKTPDLVPTLAVLGACASGEMRIVNATEKEDELVIRGGGIHGATLHGWDDHRIVMALTVAGMVAGDTEIDTAESVAVSYPGFFEEMELLGVRAKKV